MRKIDQLGSAASGWSHNEAAFQCAAGEASNDPDVDILRQFLSIIKYDWRGQRVTPAGRTLVQHALAVQQRT